MNGKMLLEEGKSDLYLSIRNCVTILGDLLVFGQLFKAFGNN